MSTLSIHFKNCFFLVTRRVTAYKCSTLNTNFSIYLYHAKSSAAVRNHHVTEVTVSNTALTRSALPHSPPYPIPSPAAVPQCPKLHCSSFTPIYHPFSTKQGFSHLKSNLLYPNGTLHLIVQNTHFNSGQQKSQH